MTSILTSIVMILVEIAYCLLSCRRRALSFLSVRKKFVKKIINNKQSVRSILTLFVMVVVKIVL